MNNHVVKTLHRAATSLVLIFTFGCSEMLFYHDTQAEGEVNSALPESPADPAARGRICTGAPGEIQGSNCIPAEMVRKARDTCRGEGQDIDGKDMGLGLKCCQGLTAIPLSQSSNEECINSAPPSILVCTRCGDRVCGQGENRCNCPTDCAR